MFDCTILASCIIKVQVEAIVVTDRSSEFSKESVESFDLHFSLDMTASEHMS